MSKQITANEVKEHSTVEKGLYIIIDNDVYEMASFVDERKRERGPIHRFSNTLAELEIAPVTSRPRRRQDSEESGRQGRKQAVLEGMIRKGTASSQV